MPEPLMQLKDVFATRRGEAAALASLGERSARWFDPDLVRAAQALHRGGLLWRHRRNNGDRIMDAEAGHKLDRTCHEALIASL